MSCLFSVFILFVFLTSFSSVYFFMPPCVSCHSSVLFLSQLLPFSPTPHLHLFSVIITTAVSAHLISISLGFLSNLRSSAVIGLYLSGSPRCVFVTLLLHPPFDFETIIRKSSLLHHIFYLFILNVQMISSFPLVA